MRLFIALTLPEDIRQACAQAARDYEARYPKGNYSAPDNYHVTLRFLGECEEQRVAALEVACQQAAAAHWPFDLALGPASAFYRGKEAILHLTLDGDGAALAALQQDCDRRLASLGFAPEGKPYQPHITLARRVRGLEGDGAFDRSVPTGAWRAMDIALMHSTRVAGKLAYVPLFRTPLGTERAVVDRLEGGRILCQRLPDGAPLALEPDRVQPGVQEQDVLTYTAGGYRVDPAATQARRQKANARLQRLFQKKEDQPPCN
jgi:2'-5' RNA ligase